jgi:hypothetical protein
MREGASLDPSPTPGAGATALSVQYLPPLTQCTPLMRFVPLALTLASIQCTLGNTEASFETVVW